MNSYDLNKRIIGITDGPASFNAEMMALGHSVVSIDPIYCFSADQITAQFYRVVDNIIEQVKQSPDDWVWHYHQSSDHLPTNRIAVLEKFITDFAVGKKAGRYITGELPSLAIDDQQFDLSFHIAAVLEMLRIAKEVRIFPLLTLAATESLYLKPLITHLQALGYQTKIQVVNYELQKGGNEMLSITSAALAGTKINSEPTETYANKVTFSLFETGGKTKKGATGLINCRQK